MELSADNIEELAIAMSDNAAATMGGMDGVVFQNKSNFSNLDVDQVISDAQECLLNSSIEPIRSARSFNDILDDICEMDKTIELEQSASNTTNSQLPITPMTDLPIGSPAFFHMPDISLQQGDYTPECSFSNQTDFLQPLGQWPEYLSSPPSALNTMQEIPQLASVPTPPPPPSPTPQETPTEMATINVNLNLQEPQYAASTPVVPMQLFNNFHFNFPPPMAAHPHFVQQCDNSNTAPQFFSPMEKNINFLMLEQPPTVPPKKRTRVQNQLPPPPPAPCFDWARVVPRKAFVQPSEVVILRPLRTRKVMSSRPSFDLASYFDTSAITIPMIRERPRCKNPNRRKQKLRTIPGADNLMFEVQLQPVGEAKDNQNGTGNEFSDMNNNNGDHLYSETEIPELDEIFKRKRRGFTTRRNPQPQERTKTPTSSHSTEEEKEVIAVLPLVQPLTEELESNSDVDSDDAPLTAVKSMKCQNCRKLFKTCRSLTIHSKRCDTIRQTQVVCEKLSDIPQIRSTRSSSMQSTSSKENMDIKRTDDKLPMGQRLSARPLTRSQTNAAKRKAPTSADSGAAKKRF